MGTDVMCNVFLYATISNTSHPIVQPSNYNRKTINYDNYIFFILVYFRFLFRFRLKIVKDGIKRN